MSPRDDGPMSALADQSGYAPTNEGQDAYRGPYEGWRRPATEPEGPPTPIHLRPDAWAQGLQAAQQIQDAPLPQLPPAPSWLDQTREIGGRMSDFASQAGTGVMEGFKGHLERAPTWQEDLTGVDPGMRELRQKVMSEAVAARPEARGIAEEYARAIGRPFGDPLSYTGVRPGAAVGWNVATGVSGETARQAYKDTPAEKWAQAVGSAVPFIGGHIIATGGLGPLRPVEGAAGLLGGRLAVTADKQAYNVAEAMAKAGRSPQEIWDATGLAKGAEGVFKHEIPDVGSSMRKNAPKAGSEATPLSKHMAHPEAFAAYPGLADIPTQAMSPRMVEFMNMQGGYAPGQGLFYNPAGYTTKRGEYVSPREILLHEMQHWIQDKEKFAIGGSPPAEIKPGSPVWDLYKSKLSAVGHEKARQYAANEFYKRLAGETEARNVQFRMDFDNATQRKIPFWATQDYPYEKQIVQMAASPRKRSKMGDLADLQMMADEPVALEPMQRQPVVRGRSGRPIETAPLPIGTEPEILERGFAAATGPKAINSFDDIRNLLDQHGTAYVRWSASPKHDMTPGAVSRDYQSGQAHGGLSAQAIDRDFSDDHIFRFLRDYGYLRSKGNEAAVPRLYAGKSVGKDSDFADSIVPSKYLGSLSPNFVRFIDNETNRQRMVLTEQLVRGRKALAYYANNPPPAGKIQIWTPKSVAEIEARLAKVGGPVEMPGSRPPQPEMLAQQRAGKLQMMADEPVPPFYTPQLRETALRKGFPLFQLGAGGAGLGMLAAQDRYNEL